MKTKRSPKHALATRDSQDRKEVLLRAAYDILRKCQDSHFVVSPMEVTVYYDEADCDGSCLMEDIAHELRLDDVEPLQNPKATSGQANL